MALRVLDAVLKVSFAGIVIGAVFGEVAGPSAASWRALLMVAGLAGVAIAGFWRARLLRAGRQRQGEAPDPKADAEPGATGAASRSENRLRDFGMISFLLGLFLLLVAFAVLFTSPPQPGIAVAGGILSATGALALAIRYRFFALLLACFLGPIGIVTAFVAWPPIFWVLLALLIAWPMVRFWRRTTRPRSNA